MTEETRAQRARSSAAAEEARIVRELSGRSQPTDEVGAPTGVKLPLQALVEAGVSPWLDMIDRPLLNSGDLEGMISSHCVRGITSNPAIFEKAILGGDTYDDDLRALAREGLSAHEIYSRLAVHDVQEAADLLRPVWAEVGGADGFVSFEVAPSLALDRDGTIEQARMYWKALGRPNLMIKVPGTPAGIEATEQLLYEGINVNVTLLFSVAAYERVTNAYIRALERRHGESKPLNVHSVASFFVSRVDTEVDRRLADAGRDDLAGVAGVANARRAYRRFEDAFSGERFRPLREAGAPVQRPLWASTGVKDERYPVTKYVADLVGPNCVNTMPLATLLSFGIQGEVTLDTVRRNPSADLAALGDAGIDLEQVATSLLEEGIEAFSLPMERLLAGIEEHCGRGGS